MKILVSGASGLVGAALTPQLESAGHSVAWLARPDSKSHSNSKRAPEVNVSWNSVTGDLDLPAAEGADAVIHLAGASIADGRWTAERKALLRSSRVDATRQLLNGLAKLRQPPQTFICASAIGYYGSRGDEVLTEASAPGGDFLATLGQEWEGAAQGAERLGMRTVSLRFGIILAKAGGALPRIVLPFRLGLGGKMGSGRQWMSWVALQDVVGLILFAMEHEEISGAVNVVAPAPVRNWEFAEILGRVMHRPSFFPTPGFALRLAVGEMADALLLSSQRVAPERATGAGYSFRFATLDEALRAIVQ
jgi:uncharacterized protein (TIGR01777 family)